MTRRPTILVVEDDDILAASLTTRLSLEGMSPIRAATCAGALAILHRSRIDAVISDIRLPDGSGEDVFWSERARFAMTPTIFATAYGDVEQAVRLVKLGAIDYLTKPFDIGALVALLDRVLARDGRRPVPGAEDDGGFPDDARVAEALDRLVEVRENLLLVGPSGSGRRTAARRLHDRSSRREAPFVVIDGASLDDRLLFGAIDATGAFEPGVLETVGEGTLLLTEIADIAPEIQARLLRFVEERRYRPVGATAERSFAGRLVTTSTRTPEESAASTAIRPDLLHRLAVIEVRIPPLAERSADLAALAGHILEVERAADPRRAEVRFSEVAIEAIESHDWPGNIREMRNRIVRAVLLGRDETIGAGDLFPERPPEEEAGDLRLETARRDAERQVIETALTENGGRIVATARSLGVSRVTLWSKMKRFGIARP
ncbi:MAG: sigma-54 dependent transcriptional regulator [Siculibacillus sp.]|nr:sigma-54 dependent transcriptional regulator [Siculibacillus sp.]